MMMLIYISGFQSIWRSVSRQLTSVLDQLFFNSRVNICFRKERIKERQLDEVLLVDWLGYIYSRWPLPLITWRCWYCHIAIHVSTYNIIAWSTPQKTPHMYLLAEKILMACASFEGLNSDRSNRCIATNENDDDDCYDHSTEIKSCRNQIKFYLWRISPRSCLLDLCRLPLTATATVHWYIVIELETAHNPDLDINVIYLGLSDSELFSSSSSLLSGSIGCWLVRCPWIEFEVLWRVL